MQVRCFVGRGQYARTQKASKLLRSSAEPTGLPFGVRMSLEAHTVLWVQHFDERIVQHGIHRVNQTSTTATTAIAAMQAHQNAV